MAPWLGRLKPDTTWVRVPQVPLLPFLFFPHLITFKLLLFMCVGVACVGDVFRDVMDTFLRASLKKAVPSIFVSIKVHYKDPEKVWPLLEMLDYVSSVFMCVCVS